MGRPRKPAPEMVPPTTAPEPAPEDEGPAILEPTINPPAHQLVREAPKPEEPKQ